MSQLPPSLSLSRLKINPNAYTLQNEKFLIAATVDRNILQFLFLSRRFFFYIVWFVQSWKFILTITYKYIKFLHLANVVCLYVMGIAVKEKKNECFAVLLLHYDWEKRIGIHICGNVLALSKNWREYGI